MFLTLFPKLFVFIKYFMIKIKYQIFYFKEDKMVAFRRKVSGCGSEYTAAVKS